MTATSSSEQFVFKAEVQKLLNIITHSIYTNREIFLRELISNASDALDKLRFEISRGAVSADADLPLQITLHVDKDNKRLVLSDTGVGMTREELVEHIGTIARSGSEAFMNQLAEEAKAKGEAAKAGADGIIGRFGVGFYSVFMVADRVRILTRSSRTGEPAWVWTSDGLGGYEIQPATAEDGEVTRGARIEIQLKEDAAEFLDKSRLESIIKRHSNFISFPILFDGEKVNTIPALWREPKFSVTSAQYEEFYKFLSLDSDGPLETLHIAVDAPVQFTALLFIPKHNNDFFGLGRTEYGLDLFVKRVLIQRQNKDLLPEYLSFLKGVVDSEDLPLNLSRETLQENLLIRKIAQTVTKQALTHLDRLAKEKPDQYLEFWRTHGRTFKLGYGDFVNRDKIGPLLRFNSSFHDDATGLTSLDDYIARCKPDQKTIYYISGPSREALKLNPHLEIFRQKGVETLYLYEPIEELAMDALREYKDFTFTSAEQAALDKLNELPDTGAKREETVPLNQEEEDAFVRLMQKMQTVLGSRVTEVRVSGRLLDSPCCLVSPEGGLTSSMQKILQVVSKDTSIPAKVLEINRDHPLVRNLLRVFKADSDDLFVQNAVEQLYDAALLLEGYLSDPHKLVERINAMLLSSSGWYAELKKC